jgi:hypothetical protein
MTLATPGKERDSNGLDYFGARYYWSKDVTSVYSPERVDFARSGDVRCL